MSDHSEPVAHAAEHGHPSAGQYIRIAIILGVITAVEVGVYYIESLAALLAPILLTLSAVKFGIVAAYYMHLKFDNKLFTFFFFGGLAIALSVALGLMTLFGTWTQAPIHAPVPGH